MLLSYSILLLSFISKEDDNECFIRLKGGGLLPECDDETKWNEFGFIHSFVCILEQSIARRLSKYIVYSLFDYSNDLYTLSTIVSRNFVASI